MKAYADKPVMTVIETAEGDLLGAAPARRLARTGGKCVYMIREQVNYKLCAWSLECARCPFHQRMESERPRDHGSVWFPRPVAPEQTFVIQAA